MIKSVLFSVFFALAVLVSGPAARADFVNPWFPVQARVLVTPYQATVVVQNVYAAPLACEGKAWGQMASGYQGYMEVAIPAVFPGTFGYAYVTPFYGDYFVAASAWVWCRF